MALVNSTATMASGKPPLLGCGASLGALAAASLEATGISTGVTVD